MKYPIKILSTLPLLLSFCFAVATDRPNLIIILADDMGYSDIGAYGGEIETPSLDSLAANGMKFSRFYNSARCCPTRASLMTGLHPHQTGIGWMTNPPETFKYDHGPGFPNYRGHLNRDCVTMAEVLKENGYATILAGKWHLGMTSRIAARNEALKILRRLRATNSFYPEYPREYRRQYAYREPKAPQTGGTIRRMLLDNAIRLSKRRMPKDRPLSVFGLHIAALAFTCPSRGSAKVYRQIQNGLGRLARAALKASA